MAIYRYSPAGVEVLLKKAALSLALTPILMTAFAGVFLYQQETGMTATMVVLLILGPILIWSSFKQRTKTRSLIESTEIELREDELIARNSQLTVTFERDEVHEIRRSGRDLIIRGQGVNRFIVLKPELEGFEELAAAVEAWAPASVKRVSDSGWAGATWVWGMAALNFGLMLVALLSKHWLIAGVASLLVAAVLSWGIAYAWTGKGVQFERRIKWMTLVGFIPVAAFVFRGCSLLFDADAP